MNRQTRILSIPFLTFMILFSSCTKWDEHYNEQEETVNTLLWDAIKSEPRYSTFVQKVEELSLDTLLSDQLSYTIFVAPDESFQSVIDTGDIMTQILSYQISPTLFLESNVKSARKLQTMLGKYALIQLEGNTYSYDEIPILFSSPLYMNGRFMEISELALPRPNLYEYAGIYSTVIRKYIDLQDSVYLDIQESKPIGFDPDGNTLYDSVFGVVNLFEKAFFPVSQEFRDITATFVIFDQDQYIDGLNTMAKNLGGEFISHEDIPLNWQFNVLLPEVTKNAMFEGMLEYTDLMKDTLKSITGDTVIIDHTTIDPNSRFLCSNGLVYTYYEFVVPADLYVGDYTVEGEDLLDSIGAGKFTWKDHVVLGGEIFEPQKSLASSASEGALVNVPFPRSFSGSYSMEFEIDNVFPMRYRLEWRANFRPAGLFAIYVNDELIGEFDNFDLQYTIKSVTGERFRPVGNFNMKDFWVENITSYGAVRVRFEYIESGTQSNNGLNIDYVKLIPDTQ